MIRQYLTLSGDREEKIYDRKQLHVSSYERPLPAFCSGHTSVAASIRLQ
jgi:hypothetical protein